MKKLASLVLAFALAPCAAAAQQAAVTDMRPACTVHPNQDHHLWSVRVYAQPKRKGYITIPSGTPVVLANQLGYRERCITPHDIYAFVEKIGRMYVATDLDNGQFVYRADGRFFKLGTPNLK